MGFSGILILLDILVPTSHPGSDTSAVTESTHLCLTQCCASQMVNNPNLPLFEYEEPLDILEGPGPTFVYSSLVLAFQIALVWHRAYLRQCHSCMYYGNNILWITACAYHLVTTYHTYHIRGFHTHVDGTLFLEYCTMILHVPALIGVGLVLNTLFMGFTAVPPIFIVFYQVAAAAIVLSSQVFIDDKH